MARCGYRGANCARKLVGIVTNRDIRFETNFERKVSEIMTSKNLVTAPSAPPWSRREILAKHKIEKLPWWMTTLTAGLITIRTLKSKTYPTPGQTREAVGGSRCLPDIRRAQALGCQTDVKWLILLMVIPRGAGYSQDAEKSCLPLISLPAMSPLQKLQGI